MEVRISISTPEKARYHIQTWRMATNRILKYCRVPQEMKKVFIAYLVSLFIGDIEHPCLVLNGSQGSGKTTMNAFIKALIDPWLIINQVCFLKMMPI